MNPRKALYFSTHRLAGYPIGRVYSDIVEHERTGWNQQTSTRLLINILRHCERSVPYYADLIKTAGNGYSSNPEAYLVQFPVLTKDLIRQHADRLTSVDLKERHWYYNTSGGSTGEPVRFIQDKTFAAWLVATQLLMAQWAGREFGQPAMLLWGSERDVRQGSMGLKMTLLNTLCNDIWLNAYQMSAERMRRFVQDMQRKAPRLILAYVQAIYELAKFIEHEKIALRPPSAIMTSAGTLYPFMRDKIEQVFQCKIFNRYGSREAGDIACDCAMHTGLHVFPWSNYIEIVDDDGKPLPPGHEGNIVVTNLTNFAMPLIRYAIGDRGILAPSQECACGRTGQILETISGRSVDMFQKQDGSLVSGGYFAQLLFFRDWVHKFQVIQKSHTWIVYKIIRSTTDAKPSELNEISARTRAVMGNECIVTFEFVPDIATSASGKYRYTMSEVQ